MRLSIIGAGGWGTALGRLCALRGHAVRLWAYEPEVVEAVRARRENELFLPGIDLPRELGVTGDLAEAIEGAEIVVFAVPSQHLRRVVERLALHLPPSALLVSASKGLEERTLLRMTQVIRDVLPPRCAPSVIALSGPTFAREVAESQPTALVAASEDLWLARIVQLALSTEAFRVYTNRDVVGVELGGALKNVIAIAAGVVVGLGLGHNPLSALITRGLAEISRLAAALGGRRRTLSGLAGMGDLVLTCTGGLSRNRAVGVELGRGRSIDAVLSSMRTVAEGVPTTRAAVALARRHGVEMPIAFQMERLLEGAVEPRRAIEELMTRPLKTE